MTERVNDPASGRALGTAAAVKGLVEAIARDMDVRAAKALVDHAQLAAQRLLNHISDQLGPDAQFGAQEALKVIFTNLDLPRGS